eukprot:TRINITY_DN7046_c0_g1_i1.p1 TRINITY_DN7046_c0_g1~~TRINITY_DN7046_c0_g1_i1.p1  ORF type:complete len:349 (-),score=74.84 TRINITY_DN7046_c0_g1_i1:254-1300(-)
MLKPKPIPNITDQPCDQVYVDFKPIGKGAYAIVLLATHTKTQKRVAIKVIDKTSLKEREKERLAREVEINSLVQHPNIVSVFEIYTTEADCCLVMEFMAGGDLFTRIVGEGSMCEEEARDTLSMILSAVAYLHHNQIAHRDLKPENIVFDHKGKGATAKLIDFGFSKMIGTQNSVLQTPVGTLEYSAPEVSAQDTYSLAVDMWSIGCITFFMVCRRPPFNGDPEEVDRLASEACFDFPDHISLSLEIKDFISNLLQLEPELRQSASEAFRHPWLTKKVTFKVPATLTTVKIESKMNDEEQFMLRKSINKMIDGKRENPEEMKKLKKMMKLVPARDSILWQRRSQIQDS